LRSLSARSPWLVFVLLPLVVLLLAIPWHVFMVVAVKAVSAPAAVPALAAMTLFTGNYLFVPGLALLLACIAWRQRLGPAWPAIGIALILILTPYWDSQPVAGPPPGFTSLQLLYQHSHGVVRGGFTPVLSAPWRHEAASHGLGFAVQYSLLLLPLVWLVRRQRKSGAAA
jgi:hypothetical protein